MVNQTKFVVCANARTGSNYLCSTLDQNKNCLCFSEIFNGSYTPYVKTSHSIDPNAFSTINDNNITQLLAKFFAQNSSYQAIGFKFLLDQGDYIKSAIINDKTIKKIILTRDTSASYISLIQAWQSNSWICSDGNENLYRMKICFNIEEFKKFDHKVQKYYRLLLENLIATNQIYFYLQYHDLFQKQKYLELLEFINTDYDNEFGLSFVKKQGDQYFKNRISNYNETINFFQEYNQNSAIYLEYQKYNFAKDPLIDYNEMTLSLQQHFYIIQENYNQLVEMPILFFNRYLDRIEPLFPRVLEKKFDIFLSLRSDLYHDHDKIKFLKHFVSLIINS